MAIQNSRPLSHPVRSDTTTRLSHRATALSKKVAGPAICGAANIVSRLKRIGHKGADSIRPGNTLESFEAAVTAGVEMIELDVLRPRAEFSDGSDWRQAPAGPVLPGAPPLLVAHDWGDAARREPLTPARGRRERANGKMGKEDEQGRPTPRRLSPLRFPGRFC